MVAVMQRGVAGMGWLQGCRMAARMQWLQRCTVVAQIGVVAGLQNGCNDAMVATMQSGCRAGMDTGLGGLQRCNGCSDAERLQGWDGHRDAMAAMMQWLQ